MQQAQRFFLLLQIDNLWKEHLQAIKFLQQAVSLRGYAQVCVCLNVCFRGRGGGGGWGNWVRLGCNASISLWRGHTTHVPLHPAARPSGGVQAGSVSPVRGTDGPDPAKCDLQCTSVVVEGRLGWG